jgi:hypothetical protein
VNGGLARSAGRRVDPSAGPSSERHVASRTHRSRGRGSAEGSGWREIVIQRLTHRPKRCAGRGTGVVMTTGSYEESLSMEGIPDQHEASAFTGRRQRWSRRPPHLPTRTNRPKKDVRPDCSLREGGGGVRVNRSLRQECQRLDRISAVGRQRPRSGVSTRSQDRGARVSVLHDDPPKRPSDGVNHPVPQSYRAEPKTPRVSPLRKWRE